MRRKLILLSVLGVMLFSATPAQAEGDFYSGGPLGTKITSLPCTISNSGAYYLSRDLSYDSGEGITIDIDHVTLDLMGFAITGPGSANKGISIASGRQNVEIRNGTVSGWNYGIYGSEDGLGHRVINVRLEENSYGIYLLGSGHLIKGCRATAGGAAMNGIYTQSQSTISGCLVNGFLLTGIGLDSQGIISGNVVIGTGSGFFGIYAGAASLVRGNEVSNVPTGIHCNGAASIIGNTVNTPTAVSKGISLHNASTTLVDQNTVLGPSTTPYTTHNLTAWRTNWPTP